MTTVYVLELGGYESWVEGVYSTYEKAEQSAKHELGRYCKIEWDISEWVIDEYESGNSR